MDLVVQRAYLYHNMCFCENSFAGHRKKETLVVIFDIMYFVGNDDERRKGCIFL